MTRDLSASHGVDRTTVKNLTGESIFISWWPEANGEGRSLGPHEQARFNGNLLETIYAWPRLRLAMEADVAAGRVAIAVCGTPESIYPVLSTQVSGGVAYTGCLDWEYYSSSSAWLGS